MHQNFRDNEKYISRYRIAGSLVFLVVHILIGHNLRSCVFMWNVDPIFDSPAVQTEVYEPAGKDVM